MSRIVGFSEAEIDRHAAVRPPEWRTDLAACVVKRVGGWVWVDQDSAAWKAMRAKYRGQPRPPLDVEGPPTAERPPRPAPRDARWLAKGAAGLAKAATRRDRAAPDVIEQRRATCDACEHAAKLLGVVKECGLCKCSIRAKTSIASEKCPVGKW